MFHHPFADAADGAAVLTVARGPVVRLSPGRADLIGRAVGRGLRPVLLTDGVARLTEPMRQVLTEAGGSWIVDDGGLRDGSTGRALLEDDDEAGPRPAAGEHAAEQAEEQLLLTATVRHRLDRVRLGVATAGLLDDLGLPAPDGWGPHEPVERPWEPARLTAFARDLSSPVVRVAVAGSTRLAGTLRAEAVDRSVRESLQLVAAVGPVGSTAAERAAAAAPAALVRLAERSVALFGVIWRRPGSADTTTAPVRQHLPRPAAMLIGAPAVRALGLDPAEMRRQGAIAVGPDRVASLVLALDGDLDRLLAFGEAIGRDRIARLLRPGDAPLVPGAPAAVPGSAAGLARRFGGTR